MSLKLSVACQITWRSAQFLMCFHPLIYQAFVGFLLCPRILEVFSVVLKFIFVPDTNETNVSA